MTVLTGPHSAADEYADLEIGLHRRDAVTWTVELRFSLPRTDAETQLDVSGPVLADIDPNARLAEDEVAAYEAEASSGRDITTPLRAPARRHGPSARWR